jgi:hypothetical protein
VTAQTARRARVLRVRAIEHRVATARLATADAAITNLIRIAGRLAMLRCRLGTVRGETVGLSLNAMAEMSQRLGQATASLVHPISEAERARADVNAERIKARRREESAAKLHGSAKRFDEQASAQRADAARPYRKKIIRLGVSI